MSVLGFNYFITLSQIRIFVTARPSPVHYDQTPLSALKKQKQFHSFSTRLAHSTDSVQTGCVTGDAEADQGLCWAQSRFVYIVTQRFTDDM